MYTDSGYTLPMEQAKNRIVIGIRKFYIRDTSIPYHKSFERFTILFRFLIRKILQMRIIPMGNKIAHDTKSRIHDVNMSEIPLK